ncbi:unnamed protein product, partial [Laminaria digitata]
AAAAAAVAAAPSQRHSVSDEQVGEKFRPVEPRPIASKPNSAVSGEAVLVSPAPTGAIDTASDVLGEMAAATESPVRLKTPTKMENSEETEPTKMENPAEVEPTTMEHPAEIKAARHESMSTLRQEGGGTHKRMENPAEIEAARHESMSSPRQEGVATTIA